MPPKRKPSYESGRKYKIEWEREFPFIKRDPQSEDKPYCKICSLSLYPKKSVIEKHVQSPQHVSRTKVSTAIDKFFPSTSKNSTPDEVKELELKLAALVCCHSSISAIDHIGELIQSSGKGTKLEKIRIHRTKASR